MAKVVDFSKYLKNLPLKKESFSDSVFDFEEFIKNFCAYVTKLSEEGKFDGLTFSKDFFIYLSSINIVFLLNDAISRELFEDEKDMISRVNLFLIAMRTCFDVETTALVVKNNEDN